MSKNPSNERGRMELVPRDFCYASDQEEKVNIATNADFNEVDKMKGEIGDDIRKGGAFYWLSTLASIHVQDLEFRILKQIKEEVTVGIKFRNKIFKGDGKDFGEARNEAAFKALCFVSAPKVEKTEEKATNVRLDIYEETEKDAFKKVSMIAEWVKAPLSIKTRQMNEYCESMVILNLEKKKIGRGRGVSRAEANIMACENLLENFHSPKDEENLIEL